MSILPLSTAELSRALSLRDLTDPAHGPHAMQVVLDELAAALARVAPVRVHRAPPQRTGNPSFSRPPQPAQKLFQRKVLIHWKLQILSGRPLLIRH